VLKRKLRRRGILMRNRETGEEELDRRNIDQFAKLAKLQIDLQAQHRNAAAEEEALAALSGNNGGGNASASIGGWARKPARAISTLASMPTVSVYEFGRLDDDRH
jgi:hypothetical protein